MAEIKYTSAQLAAIEHSGGALLISAAAGSGKTKVLVERLMRKITGPGAPDIDRFLVITYTRAAAAELRAKILEELSQRLADNPESRHLRRQISLVYKTQIATIHSFCGSILRENAHLLDIRPDFRVLDSSEGNIIQGSVLEDLLEKRYEEMTEPFRLLVDTMSAGRDDRALCQIILDTFGSLQSHPYPRQWLEAKLAEPLPEGDAGNTVWGRLLLSRAGEKTEYWIRKIRDAISALGFDAKVKAAYEPSFRETLGSLYSLSEALSKGWDSTHEFGQVDFPKLTAIRGYGEDETVIAVKETRRRCKATLDKLCAGFDAGSDELVGDLLAVRPAVDELFRLVIDFHAAYFAEKKRRGLLDFNDLEHLALELLHDSQSGEPTALAEEISLRYAEILVDEFQDVNRVQDMIFTAVSKKGRNITMVGDVKQSIYRFRLADPTIFLEKYESFSDLPSETEPRRILLSQNFRSRPEILEAANYLFHGLMSKTLGEMDYTELEYLRPGAEFEAAAEDPFEICVLDLKELETDENRVETEAAFVASRVKELMESGMRISEGGATRPLDYGDIAILMRSLKNKEEVFADALRAAGIPASTLRAVSIFENPEIMLLMSLLQIIDNPLQDVPLIAVLRSPLYGFTADELAEIRGCDRKSDFYTALSQKAGTSDKCRNFLDELGDFRSRASDFTTDRLLRYIYDTTGLPGIVSAISPGAASRLLMLLEYAREFEAKGYKGLFIFVSQLDELSKQDDPPLKASPVSSGREVLITSIHSSKGLEYPVVILADLAKRFNKEDSKKPLLIHQDLGAGPKRLDLQRRIEYPTIARLGVAAKIMEESLSEEMRVLYVAMTRAKEKLIAVTTQRDALAKLEKLRQSASYPAEPQALEDCESMGDWLLLIAQTNPNWRVRMEKPPLPQGEAPAEAEAPVVPSAELVEKIKANLEYAYPHTQAAALPSKLTATELKGGYHAREAAEEAESYVSEPKGYLFRRPRFAMEEKGLTAAERGTALHLVMQYIDFTRCGKIEGIRAEIERIRENHMISPEQAEAVHVEPIFRFFSSALGGRVLGAPLLRREFKFSILMRAGEILPAGGEESVLLQGVVDLCIEEENGLTIIDFKTDYVNETTQKDRAEFYRGQLHAYGLAMERICEKPVAGRLIYFFATGDTIEL